MCHPKKYLQGRFNWLVINQIRASFISKAITVFSFSLMLLSRNSVIYDIIFSQNKLKMIFFGSMFFLLGYMIPFFFATPEFKNPKMKRELIFDWCIVTDSEFLNSRRDMFASLVARFAANKPFDLPDGVFKVAKNQLSVNIECTDSIYLKVNSAKFYSLELELRSYDQCSLRMVVAGLMVLGIILMSVDLIVNLASLFVA